jgi:uncharacterized protein
MIITLFCISIVGGFVSGFLGLGGAVIMIPLMLTVPSILGVGHLTMKTVSGLSMVQVFFSSLSGVLVHVKNKNIHPGILLYIGIPLGVCSLISSYLSKHMHDTVILIIFAFVTISAFILLSHNDVKQNSSVHNLDNSYNKILSVIIGILVGTLSGIVGIGGGFIVIPLMTSFLNLSLKTAVGTSLGIVLLGAFLGAIGKIISFQVDYILVIPVVLGSMIASRLGARVSNAVSSLVIKRVLLAVLALSIVQTVLKIAGVI